MNPWLLSAGLLTLLTGAVHSFMGESRIFRDLRQGGLVPTLGAPLLREFQLRILWGSWHLVTCFAWCIAVLLVRAAQSDVPDAIRNDLAGASALAMVAAGILVAGATRGKHPAWAVLFLSAGLAVAGMA